MPSEGWEPIDHACRFCGGRIMQRGSAFMCFSCGARTEAGPVSDICGCGLKGPGGSRPFRCTFNPAPSPSNPAIIVIERIALPAPSKEAAAP